MRWPAIKRSQPFIKNNSSIIEQNCNDVFMRTIVTGPQVAEPWSRDHTFRIPQSQDHTFRVPRLQDHIFPPSRYNPAQYILSSTWLLGSIPMKCPLFGHCVAKKTWIPDWRLDQENQPPEKGLLGSAPVKVTVMACFGWERATFTRKPLAYSKPPSVEARCLACRTQ